MLTNIYKIMEEHFLFKGVDSKLLDEVKKLAILKKVNKNEIIYLQEDEAKYIYFVKSGWLKVFSETIDGEEAI